MSSKMEQIIEEIEEYIDGCKFQPLSSTKIIVNFICLCICLLHNLMLADKFVGLHLCLCNDLICLRLCIC